MEIAHDPLQCTALLSKKVLSVDSSSSSVSSFQLKNNWFQPNPPNLLRYDKQEHWEVFEEKGTPI